MKKSLIILTIIYILSELFFLYAYIKNYIKIFDQRFYKSEYVLDLTDYPIDENDEWKYRLNEFKNLEKVIISDKTMSLNDKNFLIEKYPDIDFFVIANINVYGKLYREDATHIDLTDVNVDDNVYDILNKFHYLKSVDFSDAFTNREIQVKLHDRFPTVEFKWNVEILDKIVSYDTEELNFEKAKITNLEEFRDSLKLLKNLKHIDLSDSNLSNETLYSLRQEFPNTKFVWKIYFSRWSMKTDAIAFSVLIANFPYVPLTSSDLEIFKYCTDLQALDLGHQAITDISAIGKYLPELRILILADNQISDITPLAHLKHLHYVELFMNFGISDISPLTNCKELVDLNLSNDYRIKDFSPILNSDLDLERIWINHTRISNEDLKLLQEKYPNAMIVTEGNESTHFGWREHERYYAMIDMFRKRNYISEVFTKYDR